MDTIKAQQFALDDALVAPANHALKLTPFYNAFHITANVPEIYMQEFWATVSIHHTSLRFKMNSKSHTLNIKNFTDMLQICLRRPDYFMSKDQSISRRNKMFWHTARDDPMFNTITVISRHQDLQIYDAILPDVLTNQEILDSKSYKEYYTVASRAKPPKAKTKQVKGLVVLSKVALSEAEQIKLATKRSKKDFHISHASSSGDGVDTQSNVPNEQQQKTSDIDEGTGTILWVPDVPPYESESDKDDDERTESDSDKTPDLNLTNVDQNEYEEDDDVIKELYDDVNVNLGNDDDRC
nr:hypothetical protein [Tanacetum cinerariifolium]